MRIALWFFVLLVLVASCAQMAFGETLSQKQSLFSGQVARLLLEAKARGYDVTLGEAWRSPEQAKFNTRFDAAVGKGVSNSLHILRLAIDINLFRGGKYLSRTEDYSTLGKWWESLSTAEIRFCWGGRFKRADGNHFSIEHDGVK